MKRLTALALCAAMLLALTACGASTPEEFYRLPKASEEYQSLEVCLQAALSGGYEYAAPLKGANTQPVSMIDMDRDGRDEAIAFFRDPNSGENPLKICFYRQDSEGDYYLFSTIQGQGNAINSAMFKQLEGGEETAEELVVSWQVSSSVYTLSAYSLDEGSAIQIMDVVNYSRYAVVDLDGDGDCAVVLLQNAATDTSVKQAEYYVCEDHSMVLRATTPLSQRMGSIEHVYSGLLADGSPALFVTGYIEDADNGELSSSYQITDILAVQDGVFRSVAMGADGSSTTLRYALADDQDINGDGIWELPSPALLSSYDPGSNDAFYAITWNQYQPSGEAVPACTTYYNSTDGWYFTIPEEWLGHLTMARADTTRGNTVERGILFYYQSGANQEPQPLLAIYKNTGTNRDTNAVTDGRYYLEGDSSAVYSAKLYSTVEGVSLSADEVKARFRQIRANWSEES